MSVLGDPEKLAAALGKTYKKPKNRDGPGKGDNRRPQLAPRKDFDRRWDNIFSKQ